MNSSASFVKSLLAQCCLGGICEWVVVCPGARNMALLQVPAAVRIRGEWTHFDERSAASCAGPHSDMGPLAVVTTWNGSGGTALAVVEASAYQRFALALGSRRTARRPAGVPLHRQK